MTKEFNKTPKFGRLFGAIMHGDWAIQNPELIKTALKLAARVELDEKAVEAYEAQRLSTALNVYYRDGVAIIPVDGAITRYMSWFSMLCGGTSVEMLALDFQAALDNPNVHSILFEINSPGGEVTGINELCERIFAARGKKPMIARVGGYCCSAAYWLGSAAGEIVIDETATLGSIGVYAAYLDNTKQLEMRGLEEIEFVSSQSPYKNADPKSDEGKNRVQKRIDAIAQVFVERVARNRDVSVETVLKEFGQGDCFVGEAAIEAGLADRFASFEETIAELAEAHTPGYERNDLNARETLLAQDSLSSKTAKEKLSLAAVEIQPNGSLRLELNEPPAASEQTEEETMPQGNETNNPTASAEDTTDNKPAEAAAQTATPAPAENSAAAAAAQTATDDKARIAALEAQLAETNKKLAASADAQLQTEMEKIAAEFAGDKPAKAGFLKSLAEKFGKESAEFKAYVADQKALAAQVEAGGLFSEKGKTGAISTETSSSTEAKINQLARDRATADKISFEKAYMLVLEENPDLYAAYRAESSK